VLFGTDIRSRSCSDGYVKRVKRLRHTAAQIEEGLMLRRLVSSAALVACAGVYALAATERATFILTDGERKSGTVVFHGDQHENLINGYLNLGVDNGKDMTFPMEQVAVIDFVGGQPPTTELAQLGTRHMLVTRDGGAQQGRFVNMTGGDTLFWENLAGQRQQFAIRDVSRVYLNTQSARIAFNYSPPPAVAAAPAGTTSPGRTGTGAPGTTTTQAQAQAITVRVDTQQPWTDTGLTVGQGDRVAFETSGQVQSGRNSRRTFTPDANPRDRRSSSLDPNLPAGALLGRVGNRPAFAIGTQKQTLVMPASGRLMLGINDNGFGSSANTVTVIVSGGRPDAQQNWQDRPNGQDRQERQDRSGRDFR
jgi:hypothetical protein